MSTLLLRLAGPMQSWGTQSRFQFRDTGLEPSKSGVVGLLCAALGKPREELPDDGFPTLSELAALGMGIRVDAEGVMMADYHTAMDVVTADGKSKRTALSTRYYLADASFLVGLEGHRSLLERLNQALATPVWSLALGRKSFIPGEPVRLPDGSPHGPGVQDLPLLEALRTYPWPGKTSRLRCVLDTEDPHSGEVRNDVPVCFLRRQFVSRFVHTLFVDVPGELS